MQLEDVKLVPDVVVAVRVKQNRQIHFAEQLRFVHEKLHLSRYLKFFVEMKELASRGPGDLLFCGALLLFGRSCGHLSFNFMLEALRNDRTESVTVRFCNAYCRPASERVVDRRFTLVYTEVATELGFFTAAFSRCDHFASEDDSFAAMLRDC